VNPAGLIKSGNCTGGVVGAGSADLRMWQMPMATCCASAVLQALCASMFSGKAYCCLSARLAGSSLSLIQYWL